MVTCIMCSCPLSNLRTLRTTRSRPLLARMMSPTWISSIHLGHGLRFLLAAIEGSSRLGLPPGLSLLLLLETHVLVELAERVLYVAHLPQ